MLRKILFLLCLIQASAIAGETPADALTPANTALIPVSKLEQDSYDWFARHEAVLAWQKQNKPEIVLVGDSITHFWGGEPATIQNGKPKANGAGAWKKTFGDSCVLNMGFGWDRTQNVLWRLANGEADGLSPKTIILNIGTNNFSGTKNARANTPEEVCAGILEILRQLRAKMPAAQIVVMGIFPRANTEYMKCIEKLNTLLAGKLKDAGNARFLDIGEKMKNADGKILPNVFSDGTHPTEKGYAIWGEALRDAGVI